MKVNIPYMDCLGYGKATLPEIFSDVSSQVGSLLLVLLHFLVEFSWGETGFQMFFFIPGKTDGVVHVLTEIPWYLLVYIHIYLHLYLYSYSYLYSYLDSYLYIQHVCNQQVPPSK